METSDGVKTALRQEAEANVLKLLRSLQEVKKGDLKGLEQQVMETVLELVQPRRNSTGRYESDRMEGKTRRRRRLTCPTYKRVRYT